ncbi:LysR family transcriptional regulator [Shimia thalassica]|uniref:LysR family transcriptional regulator n=1 Tax=Shimia thalassica TaxID=1715693 RepID=UPI0027327DFB|nr:LysR family transcriptional regulator [Shimia thalassica]MDP2518443.1 LysR family transcriptional regulator [Shimia thalassica]
MDNLSSTDWSLIQVFLAVAQTGSLSAGARRLHSSQPTVGRHIKTLETTLGVELFHRHARGLELTELGQDVFHTARAMQRHMSELTLKAAGAQTSLAGDVRITCSVFMAHHVVPDILASIRTKEPEIKLDLLATDDTENLLFREADIAIRMYRPKQLDMIAKHLGDITLGLFASESYVARRGLPQTPEDFINHDIVGYDRNDLIIRSMTDHGWSVTRDTFCVRCDNQTAYWELVKAGCGIGFCQKHTAMATDGIIDLDLGVPLPTLPVWLTAHEAMRHTPRISRVWDLLSDGLQPFVS